jgi:hypothetical protein
MEVPRERQAVEDRVEREREVNMMGKNEGRRGELTSSSWGNKCKTEAIEAVDPQRTYTLDSLQTQ